MEEMCELSLIQFNSCCAPTSFQGVHWILGIQGEAAGAP